MMNQDMHTNVQAVRRVYEHGHPANSTSSSAEIIYVTCQSDTSSGRDIILWDDILDVFSNALYVRSGSVALPFLKGPDFKKLDPLRIAAVPGVTLDVVVRSQLSEKKLSMESLQKALPGTHQESSTASTVANLNTATTNAAATVKRNPTGGLVEEAMDAYRNNDNPAFGPRPRGPQAVLYDPTPKSASDTPPTSQRSVSNSQTPALQEPASTIDDVDGEMIIPLESGDKYSQYALGDKYYHALGVPRDYQTAMKWYLKAAQQGHAEAQYMIGRLQEQGNGTPQDYAAAMEWFLKSANQGFAPAQNTIGWLYRTGQGVAQNYSLAMDWYLKAARQGHSFAQNNIGVLYENGDGLPQDYSQAMNWYRKAADQGYDSAQKNVARMYEHGLGVPKDIAQAIEWYRKAVTGGNADAKECLYRLEQESSNSVTGDTKRGMFKWLFK